MHVTVIGQYNKPYRSSESDHGTFPCVTMVRKFEDNDKGRGVLTADGTLIGHVQVVAGDVAHVSPENDLDGALRQKLGWTADEQDVYELPHESVRDIDDRGIHLK